VDAGLKVKGAQFKMGGRKPIGGEHIFLTRTLSYVTFSAFSDFRGARAVCDPPKSTPGAIESNRICMT